MDLSAFLQMLVNGTMIGFQLALFATGLTLVYGIMLIINFAHGELYMLGAFAVFFFAEQLGLNYFVSLVLAMIMVGFVAIATERIFFKPLRGQHIPSFIMSCGLAFMFQVVAVLAFGIKDKAIDSVFPGVISILGASVSVERLMVSLISAVLIIGFYIFLLRSRSGRAMRAVMQDPEAAALQGVNINQTSSLGMGIGAALAAAAGGLLAPIFIFNPWIGPALTWEGFIVVCLGGKTSLPGTLLAAFILGYVKSFVTTLVDPVTALMSQAAILGIILTLRPQGLLGHE